MELIAITENGEMAKPVSSTPQVAAEVAGATTQLYRAVGYEPPWIGYLAIEDGTCVGTCGFKSPPQNNRVEIAYFTFPEYESRGVATRMAAKLIRMALDKMPAVTVAAQTLPEENASTSVLRKQPIFFNATWLIVICALLCGACTQASTQSAQTPSSNSTVQTTSPSATANPTTQTSPTPQNVNKVVTSINTNTVSPEVADKGKVQRVQFARGRTSATFNDAVYQNKDNEYLLEAKAGQTMTVSMKVDEKRNTPYPDSDVVFQIIKAGDSEPFAKPDGNSWQGRLPETGEYTIRVISFTDNNGYTLKITIR